MDGKIVDVLIENNYTLDPNTGVRFLNGFIVWADKGADKIVKAVPGVHHVSEVETMYTVRLDPRYDREWVRAEIEAAIKCRE